MKLKKIERRNQIEAIASRSDYVALAALAPQLGVSESTVRRDIEEMENEGLLFRNQGLIIWNHPDQSHQEKVYFRSTQNVEVKQALARKAATLLEPNDVVFIDTGTTMYQLAKAVGNDLPLTVVTNDLAIALELETRTAINTIVLGGAIRHGTHSLVGGFADRNLEGLRFAKMFVATGGISLDDGFMYFN
ncbi:MAG: DeoR/GlpR family DNA-binding transcription regulator, partial [Deltaproteobacteria bacterium]|nr:DeoR/GlpR family DNA-binding transcription regulator [Deltaproteobacteria bacterium]